MLFDDSGLRQNFRSDDAGQMRMAIVKKFCKTIKIGKRGSRPFELHLLCQGLNAGVPQV